MPSELLPNSSTTLPPCVKMHHQWCQHLDKYLRGRGQTERQCCILVMLSHIFEPAEVTTVAMNWHMIKHIQDEEIDFTDRIYQDKLPMVARSTASRAIKSNIKLTEIMVEPNINRNRQKINAIINMHMQRRLREREENPERFNIKPTLGERAIRRPSVVSTFLSSTNLQRPVPVASVASTEIRGKMGVHFKTIQVKQAERLPFDVNLSVTSPGSYIKGL
ncbi:spermatogenesis-associated protein 4 isoform X2 [Hemicordylus capensis]|uniref:spermatogenesis-associated protein 4 isoform X2 n=1 Tax=Hemicordylus capensis TaxID=884348 RepID=UPI002304B106|nr:spermatogenesis-associated protein 4 isoform X2 [Hemicordylus capensis]